MKEVLLRTILSFSLIFSFSSILIAQNNALDFDGAGDHVVIPEDDAAFDFDNTFTLEAWFKTTDADGGGIITKNSHVSGTVRSWGLHFYGAEGTMRFYTQTNVSTTIDLSDSGYNDGVWHHIAAVKDGNTAYLYIDGDLKDSGSWGGGSVVTNYQTVIGRFWSGHDSGYSDAQIDEIRAWNIARSQADIQATMNMELAGNEAGLVAYYNFNQGTACSNNTGETTLNDSAGSNNGTMNGFDLTGGLVDPCESNFTNDVPLSNDPAVPTMGEWALIIFGLLIASLGTITVMRWQRQQKIATEVIA